MSQPNTGVDEPVILINAFTVPVAESETFLRRWQDTARIMAAQPGFVRARMHRALSDDVELRFVNVAEWTSGAALNRATASPEFLATARHILADPDLHVTARPGVYQVAVDVRPA